jgi:DNA-binding winged helix-turn-helix (wHTH) protein
MGIRFGLHELDEQRFLLQRDGVRLRVRPKVFDLLVHLVRHRERVVVREELVMALWGTTAVGLGSLSGLVNELRQVLGEAGRGPSSIRTVHARGYQFVAEIETRKIANAPAARGDSDATRDGDPDGTIAIGLGQSSAATGAIRASFARVPTLGARAVIVVEGPGSSRSNMLDRASRDLSHAGFEVHRLRPLARRERHPIALVDGLIDVLVERYGIEAIRSTIPVRARELLERIGGTRMASSVRPRDPLASHQYDERVSRNAADLLRELAQRRPLALVLDEHQQTASVASLTVSPLLGLLGNARVFVVCTAGVADASDADEPEGWTEDSETRIEYVRLPLLNRSRLNEILESRGLAALPTALADALMAHVRDDEASFESVAGWMQAEAGRHTPGTEEAVPPNIDRRMRRVEPDTISRRPRFGTS